MILTDKNTINLTLLSLDVCIEACLEMETALVISKAEQHESLIKQIRDCADVCSLAMAMLKRNSLSAKSIVLLCIEICEQTAKECSKYEKIEQCILCSISCKSAADECKKIC